ncbi:HAD family hydrolase [uncultured Pseudokineococcus sp.]|uniref:HAD family hydrolase n=1 Tax=uncultured Pseudokineococcus sp. TaxID=1642928 RepID=UPI002637129E|nr:HAD-IA family hydrolase [uncultured Pseudokineococcus sp.]
MVDPGQPSPADARSRGALAPTTVVLDLGNVLVRWEPERAWAALDPARVAAFHERVDFRAWNLAMDGGRSTAASVADVAAAAPGHEVVAQTYVDRFLDTLAGPVPGTRAVLEELDRAGVRLLALTNWSAELFERARPLLEGVVGLSAFEAVVVSGVEGLTKPDPALFRRVVERFDLDASRTAFVDDARHNVDGAASVGLRAVHFTGAEALRAELAAMGLPVAPVSPRV